MLEIERYKIVIDDEQFVAIFLLMNNANEKDCLDNCLKNLHKQMGSVSGVNPLGRN